MSWRRVAVSITFGIGVTTLGSVLPMDLGLGLWLPGTVASSLLPDIKSVSLDISLHIWVWLFVNVTAWAFVGELALFGWSRLRQWEARSDVHA